MGIEDLIGDIRGLEPDHLAEVIDLVARLRDEESEAAESQATFDAVMADPVARARFDAMIQVGRDAAARGEVIDGPTAMAALRKKYRLDEAQG